MGFLVHSIPVGPFETKCHIIDAGNGQCIIIDPGSDADRIVAIIEESNLVPCSILCTHAHADHVSALALISDRYGIAPYMHAKDLAWAFSAISQIPPWFPVTRQPKAAMQPVEDGQKLSSAGLAHTVLHTPGHTPGGICIHFPSHKVLFSGDTLFQESVGRTDLPGGHTGALMASIRRLMLLPDDTTVYAGHGAQTTIGYEKQNNPYLR